jgi:hypothetical protein
MGQEPVRKIRRRLNEMNGVTIRAEAVDNRIDRLGGVKLRVAIERNAVPFVDCAFDVIG